MTDNPTLPETEQKVEKPMAEPAPAPQIEPAPALDATPFAAEEPLTEVEDEDEKNMEKAENQFDELDEELVDVHESADTIWLLRRVGIGILKVLLIFGGIALLAWLIWGDNKTIKSDLEKVKEAKIEKSIKKVTETVKENIPEIKIVENTQMANPETPLKMLPHPGGLNLASWNYWLETQRLQDQDGTPGDVMRWKRDVESFFEIPLQEQVQGANNIERSHKVAQMIYKIDVLLQQAEVLQSILAVEISDYTTRSNYAKEQSLANEELFLEAMKSSDPVSIGYFLGQKADFEKDVQLYAVEAEGRKIFSEKISQYTQTLANVKTAVTANRKALEQNIKVVNFPADPFGRVIPASQWQGN